MQQQHFFSVRQSVPGFDLAEQTLPWLWLPSEPCTTLFFKSAAFLYLLRLKTVMKDGKSATAFLAEINQRFVILRLQHWHQGLTIEQTKKNLMEIGKQSTFT